MLRVPHLRNFSPGRGLARRGVEKTSPKPALFCPEPTGPFPLRILIFKEPRPRAGTGVAVCAGDSMLWAKKGKVGGEIAEFDIAYRDGVVAGAGFVIAVSEVHPLPPSFSI
jgi:hypothetical protein